ncbi:hypothetical protein AVEN_2554-1 [Araneus ventricosus]|uniref:Uncharacterized protein n=1 Tax=Araneus ventricosus TaxID=182803 RepID=A0A4Y2VNL7_ARAVE|nr:hypothetical protein AVEN_2554-1 [Araneus ventricosus]
MLSKKNFAVWFHCETNGRERVNRAAMAWYDGSGVWLTVSGPEESSFETRFHKRNSAVKADMVHANSVRTKLPLAGVAWKFVKVFPVRCRRRRHPTIAQN